MNGCGHFTTSDVRVANDTRGAAGSRNRADGRLGGPQPCTLREYTRTRNAHPGLRYCIVSVVWYCVISSVTSSHTCLGFAGGAGAAAAAAVPGESMLVMSLGNRPFTGDLDRDSGLRRPAFPVGLFRPPPPPPSRPPSSPVGDLPPVPRLGDAPPPVGDAPPRLGDRLSRLGDTLPARLVGELRSNATRSTTPCDDDRRVPATALPPGVDSDSEPDLARPTDSTSPAEMERASRLRCCPGAAVPGGDVSTDRPDTRLPAVSGRSSTAGS